MPEALTITQKLDQIRRLTERGVEYWQAREIRETLGYDTWRNFSSVIQKAIASFETAGEVSAHHFVETVKMVQVGSGAVRENPDYFLSRPACYIIAMNGDSTKPEIAEAQRYYAVRTRQMEKILQLIGDQHRVDLRGRVRVHNRDLGSAAKEAGVKRYGLFHGAGIRAMYGMALNALKARRGIKDNDWLGRAGIEELAANEFRITQTKAKLERERIKGEDRAINAHSLVAGEVRDAISRMGGTMPEDLPVEPPIKEVEKKLAAATKQIGAKSSP